MRHNGKIACGALAVSITSGMMALVYLITLGVRESETAEPVTDPMPLMVLGAVMIISTLIMIAALPKKK